MKVIAHDRLDVQSVEVQLQIADQNIAVSVPCVSFEQVLKQADFISLHVPKQANGEAVIGINEFGMLKKECILINTSRGGVIDEEALIAALDAGLLRYGCLDVFVGEPKPNAALLRHPSIISTPHIGASTVEAQERIGLEIADNVKRIYQL
jgi:D-3-phosphoglycerate dehydrogenase / 2-oxoglutarate reductase